MVEFKEGQPVMTELGVARYARKSVYENPDYGKHVVILLGESGVTHCHKVAKLTLVEASERIKRSGWVLHNEPTFEPHYSLKGNMFQIYLDKIYRIHQVGDILPEHYDKAIKLLNVTVSAAKLLNDTITHNG